MTKQKHIHIPLDGMDGHITWVGDIPPSKSILSALNKMAKSAFYKVSDTEDNSIQPPHTAKIDNK